MWEETGYRPSEAQRAFHDSRAPIRLVAGGVRSGKSYSLAQELHKYAVVNDGLCWLVGPDYEQCRIEFGYLLQMYSQAGLVDEGSVSFPSKGMCRFRTKWGFMFQTKSSNDPISLASYAPDVIAMCEAAQQSHDAYLKCIERSTQKGAPVILSGTFESSLGWYAELWERFQGPNPEGGVSISMPSWSNVAIFPGGASDPKILQAQASVPEDLFQERYGGVPCKPRGLVFPEFERKLHVRRLEELFDPGLPVELWVDPAKHTYAVLFVQVAEVPVVGGRIAGEVRVLDEIYRHDVVAQAVIPEVIATPWWEHSCTSGVIDIAATAQSAQASQIEVWRTELAHYGQHGVSWRHNRVMEEEWRAAIKLRLKPPEHPTRPLLYFAEHLEGGLLANGLARGILGEIQTYRWSVPRETTGLPVRPVKRNEDALSALGYGMFAHFGPVLKRTKYAQGKRRSYWFEGAR